MATATMTGTSQKMFSARRFIGKDTFDVNANHVGEVEDLILDVDTACAKWAVVSAGGVLGIGGSDYIVPIQTISIEQDSGKLMLSFEESRLRNAPMYDKDNPPDWSDESWMRSLYAYYDISMPQGGGAMPGGQGAQTWEQGWQQGYRQGSRQTYQNTYQQEGQGRQTYEQGQQGYQQPIGSRQGMGRQGGQGYGGGQDQDQGQGQGQQSGYGQQQGRHPR